MLEWASGEGANVDTVWTTELSWQPQPLRTQQIISKNSWKKPFFSKHLLDISSGNDREKVNIEII